MALRVLLADESSTIKKVMQLALSDFAVEVKAVPVGLDVLSVTKDFKPDIIFADVLLTKRSGYDVCADLKADSSTNKIPVVLMWSGFMEIDEERAQSSRADRRLEKPFDAEHLRSLVQDLVQKTKSNPVSSFLSFPDMPDFAEESPAHGMESGSLEPLSNFQMAPQQGPNEESDFLNIPELSSADEIPLEIPGEEFAAVPLTTPKTTEDSEEEGGWSHQDLSKFKIQIPETESEDFASKFVIPQDELSEAQLQADGAFEEVSFGEEESSQAVDLTQQKKKAPQAPPLIAKAEKSVKDQMLQTLQKGVNAKPNPQSKVDLDVNMMEKIIREEAREVIESICWKVLPEIAERIVREELNKILRETERSI